LNSVLLYCEKSGPRLKYILHLLLEELLGISFSVTNSKEEFQQFEGPKINYSPAILSNNEIFVPSCGLVQESGIKEKNLQLGQWKNELTLFHIHPTTEIPFDLFSAAFYLISRYEEYLPHIRDHFDRFEAESSLAFNHQFLTKALVNRWTLIFSDFIKLKYPNIQFKKTEFQFISTIDVDNAFAFKQKGSMRSLGGYVRGLVNLNWKNIIDRSKTILGKMQDPFDTYAFQLELQKKYNLKVVYFFLLGDYGVNDKNLPSNNLHLRKLIKHLSDYALIGIHPSFGSNANADQVKKEISRLSGIIHRDVKHSRQHFSCLQFPQTYQRLIEFGIEEDYSMGYHNHPGFRASISTPFNWYDLETETETQLRIVPFSFSESTLKFSVKSKPGEAIQKVIPLIEEIKKTGGTFTSMFHNESLGDYGEWKGWKNFYEQVIHEALRIDKR
jgi:hypothetical protein